jgi:alcohol dehydrogenase class IV
MHAVTYRYSALERVIFGQSAASAIISEVDRIGRQRVFVVTSGSVALSAPFKKIIDALAERCVGIYSGVTAHGPRECVISGSAAARLAEPDLLLAIGGGSAIDAAKLMLLCLRHDITKVDELDAYRGFPAADSSVRPVDESRWLRLVAIPTTLSAAEFTWFGGAYDTERRVKDPYGHPMMVPQAIILDPATTLATPLPLFLSTGMKAVDHAAERLASLRIEPLTEALAAQALRLLSRGLPQVLKNPADLDVRLDCQKGMAIAMVGPSAGVELGQVMRSDTFWAAIAVFPMATRPAYCFPRSWYGTGLRTMTARSSSAKRWAALTSTLEPLYPNSFVVWGCRKDCATSESVARNSRRLPRRFFVTSLSAAIRARSPRRPRLSKFSI